MPRNQKVKYFLRMWAEIDKNMAYLSSVEKVEAKILYLALNQLEPDERKFLADKYRVEGIPFTDTEMAIKTGITFKAYRDKRIAIEDKFRPLLHEQIDRYQDELHKAIHPDYWEKRKIDWPKIRRKKGV